MSEGKYSLAWTYLLGAGLALAWWLLAVEDDEPPPAPAEVAAPRLQVFVRTDCPISNRYAPELERIRTEFGGRLAESTLVYVDEGGAEHSSKHGLLAWRVRSDLDRAEARRLGVTATPEAVVLDVDGAIAYRGRIDDRFVAFGKQRPEPTTTDLRDALTAALAGQAPRVRRTEVIGCPVQAPPSASKAGVTWASDVATIVHDRCGTCHRPGGSGPFPLLTYGQVAERTEQIETVLEDRFMPPWKPTGRHGAFAGDRRLTPAQDKALRAWLAADAPSGDLDRAPPPPRWQTGWTLGEPDLVVRMSEPFAAPAEGTDIYRNFVLPVTGLDGAKHVRAWEFRPTVPQAVHHAIVSTDSQGWARREDAKSPATPGFEGMELGDVQAPDGFYLVWAPGNQPGDNPAGLTWNLRPGTDLVLQLHVQPTGKPERVGAEIGLWFAERPSPDRAFSLRIGDVPIDIPAGARKHVITDTFELPVPVTAVSVFPHAHYLGRTFKLTAGERTLLEIDDWDFSWQDDYVWAKPVALEAGAKLELEVTYDNSEHNVRNPSRPPVRVVAGPRSEDEMGNVTLTLIPESPADLSKLKAAVYRRLTERTPSDHRAWFNLGNALGALDAEKQGGASLAAYQRAVELNPDFVHAHVNKAIAHHRARQPKLARKHAGRALELDPDQPAAKATVELLDGADPRKLAADARKLLDAGEPVEAEAAYRHALALAPGLAHAHADLGVLLVRSGRPGEARSHFETAARLLPDDPAMQRNLALISSPKPQAP